jgi:hypothetical protein
MFHRARYCPPRQALGVKQSPSPNINVWCVDTTPRRGRQHGTSYSLKYARRCHPLVAGPDLDKNATMAPMHLQSVMSPAKSRLLNLKLAASGLPVWQRSPGATGRTKPASRALPDLVASATMTSCHIAFMRRGGPLRPALAPASPGPLVYHSTHVPHNF